MNTTANDTTGKYSFDADANRNGKIDQQDLAIAQKNLGVGTTVSPVISANLDPTSVADPKNRITNIPTVHITGTATPNATIAYAVPGGVLGTDHGRRHRQLRHQAQPAPRLEHLQRHGDRRLQPEDHRLDRLDHLHAAKA